MRVRAALCCLAAGAAHAESAIPHCAVHSASRNETVTYLDPIDIAPPSESGAPKTPRDRDGLVVWDYRRIFTRVNGMRVVGSDWTTVDGLRIGMTRANVLARHGALLPADVHAEESMTLERVFSGSNGGGQWCPALVSFDAADRISEIFLPWHEPSVHPDPPPDL